MTSRLTNRGSVFGRSIATRLIVNHNRSVDVHTERGKVPFVFVIDKERKNAHTHTHARTHTHTHRQTDTQTRVTTIHFASSTTHAKCNNEKEVIFFICFALLLAAHTSLSPYDLCTVMIYCDFLCVTMSFAP